MLFSRVKGWFLFLLLAGLLNSPTAWANDSAASGIGGNWRMLKGEHRSVQMVREKIIIDGIDSGSFHTTADFVFRNHGRAQWVTMGFPDQSGGDSSKRVGDPSTLHHFRSWIDGRRVRVRFHRIKPAYIYNDALGLWTKRIYFKRGQTRRVRVRYTSGSGGGYSSGDQWLEYDFTGGNWWGKVRESVLEVRFPTRHWDYFLDWKNVKGDPKGDGNPQVTRRGLNLRFRWTNWQAQHGWELQYKPSIPDDLNRSNKMLGWPVGRYLLVKGQRRGFPLDSQGNIPHDHFGRDAFLLNGHLWVRSNWIATAVWDDNQKHMKLKRGKRSSRISGMGAMRNARSWPLNPHGSIWMNQSLFVPARRVAYDLGLRFVVNGRTGFVRFEKSPSRGDIFRLN